MLWPDAEIEQAASFTEAYALAAASSYDLIMTDLGMPGAAPLVGVKALLAAAPHTPVLIVTGNEEDDILLELVETGISGFIPKTASSDVIELAIRLALAGERYLPRRVGEIATARATGQAISASSFNESDARLIPMFTDVNPSLRPASPPDHQTYLRIWWSGGEAGRAAHESHSVRLGITQRQREVLRHIAAGETNKEIARVFNLSPATIKTHTAAIIAILGVSNRTEAVAHAREQGLI
jgi:DNA-binding NarL/FixJ family response regulator